MSTTIHPTAIVAPTAELDTGVTVEPYAIIGPHLRIGRDSIIGAHSILDGRTTLGHHTHIYPHASLGTPPQDLKYAGEESELILGNHNTVREFATLNRGTAGGGMATRVGDNNFFMHYSHVAHDGHIGSNNVIANGVQLAGHVTIQDYVVVGGLVGIHQFVTIGESVILGAGAMVSQDVPPFCNATGDRATLHGLNTIGMKRRQFSPESIAAIKKAYRIFFRAGLTVAAAAERARAEVPNSPEVERFMAFIQESKRGVCRP